VGTISAHSLAGSAIRKKLSNVLEPIQAALKLLNIFSIGSYVKTKSSHGGHLEFPICQRFTSLAQDHPMVLKSSPLKPVSKDVIDGH
jgi:hypothetical protein